jgi:peptidoglycan/LPS O-acetylase OafA/YrhL
VLAVAAGGVVAVTLWRAVLVLRDSGVDRILFSTDTRIDAVLLGCALAIALELGRVRTAPVAALPIGAVALAMAGCTSAHGFAAWGMTVGVAASGLVVWSAATRDSRLLAHRVAGWVGRHSYAIYLWDLPIAFACERHLGGPLLLRDAAAVPIVVVLAALSGRFVEQPLRERAARARARASAAVSAG